ncbi:MAG TPA: hypothetical protein VF665_22080 [Longimicrobium sp.]|jgi:hypothetical protein|uniref:hypothetical protein n=1 Tax=Longimicrobium sp. TaxID=2029185 RepID=UPI002ED921A4
MTEWVLHSGARPGGVARAQIRAVGLALRGPAMVAGGVLVLATALAVADMRGSTGFNFHPERWMVPGLSGLLLPMAVWRGEERFGPGFLWTLPVDRRGHALAKVGAGWVWLMAAVALFVLWLLAVALASGGNVLGPETLRMIPPLPYPGDGGLNPAAITPTAWTPNPVLWLVPFTAATAMYLLSSALALATPHPFRWLAGVLLTFFLIAMVSDAADADGVAQIPEYLVSLLVGGRYGLESVLIASTETLKVETRLTTGEMAVVWRGLPDPAQWARSTLLWTALAAAALWAAASRHRETRRA